MVRHTNQIHDINTANDQANNDVADNADGSDREDADHGEEGGEVLVILVVELYPVHPAAEATPVNAGDGLHHCEATVRPLPHGDTHERRRVQERARLRRTSFCPLEKILPGDKQEHTDYAND